MQATAKLRYLMMAPRKVRLVADLVKGKSVEEAITILQFTNRAAARPLRKTIMSAAANALATEGTSRLKSEDLSVSKIQVDSGPIAKRIQFRAMGRAYRIRKRFSHITVVVRADLKAAEAIEKSAAKKSADEEKKPARAKAKRKSPARKKTGKAAKTTRKKTPEKANAGKSTGTKKRATTKKSTTRKSSATAGKTTGKKKPAAGKTKAAKKDKPEE